MHEKYTKHQVFFLCINCMPCKALTVSSSSSSYSNLSTLSIHFNRCCLILNTMDPPLLWKGKENVNALHFFLILHRTEIILELLRPHRSKIADNWLKMIKRCRRIYQNESQVTFLFMLCVMNLNERKRWRFHLSSFSILSFTLFLSCIALIRMST